MSLDWVDAVLAREKCWYCEIGMNDADLIGLRLAWHPKWKEVTPLGPCLQIVVGCGYCQMSQGVDVFPTKRDLLMLTEHLYGRLRTPAFEMTAKFLKQVQLSSDPRLQFDREPIDDEELERFLRLIERVSFKHGSKSLRRWLRRMGIDPDRPP